MMHGNEKQAGMQSLRVAACSLLRSISASR